MPISLQTKADIAFKKSQGKSTTDAVGKEVNNEAEGISLYIAADNIFTDPVTPVPAASPVELVSADLVYDSTSNGQAYFAVYPAGHSKAGQRVVAGVEPKYGTAYIAKPFAGSSPIPEGDPRDWVYQYESGVFFQETPFATPAPTRINTYAYTGRTLTTMLSGITAGGGVGTLVVDLFYFTGSTSFTASRPVGTVIAVEHNGAAQIPGVDYSLGGGTFTLLPPLVIQSGDPVVLRYFTSSGGTAAGGFSPLLKNTIPVTASGQTAFTVPAYSVHEGFYVNGLWQEEGADYTLSGTSLTYIQTAYALNVSDRLVFTSRSA